MFERGLRLTEDLLRASGPVLTGLRGSDLGARRKRSQSDLVTAADVASELVMLGLLERRVPEDGILSEECGVLPGSSGDVWVIDPLDGTTNYASGLDEFGVIVGLTRNGAPIAAACSSRQKATSTSRAEAAARSATDRVSRSHRSIASRTRSSITHSPTSTRSPKSNNEPPSS